MEKINFNDLETLPKKFNSPEEELVFLRAKVAEKEKQLTESKTEGTHQIEAIGEHEKEQIISEQISEYKKIEPEKILTEEYQAKKETTEQIVLDLAPEEHDKNMEELLGILEEQGIKNTLTIVEKMNDPHIEDDFHRILIQFIKTGHLIKGFDEKLPMFKALNMTLYEITLPSVEEKEGGIKKTLKELISSMEQFYSGMLSVSTEGGKYIFNYFTFELALSQNSDQVIFYASIPNNKKDLFEKQILSIFHNAKIKEVKNDYNIFNENGFSAGAYVKTYKNPIFPIKTYDNFDYDPLNILLNSFSKLKTQGEGAAIQIILSPADDSYTGKFRKALTDIQKGVPIKEAIDISETFVGDVAKGLTKLLFKGTPKVEEKKDLIDPIVVENIKNKISSPIIKSNIRIISSAETIERAREIISDIESSFNQFENSQSNKFIFEELKKGYLNEMVREFIFRTFSQKNSTPLNIKELTTVMHLPTSETKGSPQLKQAKSGSAPAMVTSKEGILLGINKHRNVETEIHFSDEDRLRHFYVIGQTGTGKSTLLKNMITQDIINGEGVCMIDPHGSDILDILSIVPKERYEDVIYFDPSYTARPMGLNMLEYDVNYPEQKTFVVNEMLSIFNKLFDMKTAGGPMFEQYFRNAVMLVLDDPQSGNTLLEIPKVLSNKEFRAMKLSKCKNPLVIQFWTEVAEKAGGEGALQNIVPYITSKFDIFLSNEIMRPIIAQEKSSFNFREIMDNRKILLVNLSKGRLGDINSHLIGLILVGKILMAALSRTDSVEQKFPNFYLYIDEFQNITTDSISTILSEARKYKLSLNIAHQFIAQLEDKIKASVFGNVGSIATFRVGVEDAEFLAKQFEPIFSAKDIINLDNRNAYLKMLEQGSPIKPFSIETLPPVKGDPEVIHALKELSYLKYGEDRQTIEEEIMKKYTQQNHSGSEV